jgi:hypothetical protein
MLIYTDDFLFALILVICISGMVYRNIQCTNRLRAFINESPRYRAVDKSEVLKVFLEIKKKLNQSLVRLLVFLLLTFLIGGLLITSVSSIVYLIFVIYDTDSDKIISKVINDN